MPSEPIEDVGLQRLGAIAHHVLAAEVYARGRIHAEATTRHKTIIVTEIGAETADQIKVVRDRKAGDIGGPEAGDVFIAPEVAPGAVEIAGRAPLRTSGPCGAATGYV